MPSAIRNAHVLLAMAAFGAVAIQALPTQPVSGDPAEAPTCTTLPQAAMSGTSMLQKAVSRTRDVAGPAGGVPDQNQRANHEAFEANKTIAMQRILDALKSQEVAFQAFQEMAQKMMTQVKNGTRADTASPATASPPHPSLSLAAQPVELAELKNNIEKAKNSLQEKIFALHKQTRLAQAQVEENMEKVAIIPNQVQGLNERVEKQIAAAVEEAKNGVLQGDVGEKIKTVKDSAEKVKQAVESHIQSVKEQLATVKK